MLDVADEMPGYRSDGGVRGDGGASELRRHVKQYRRAGPDFDSGNARIHKGLQYHPLSIHCLPAGIADQRRVEWRGSLFGTGTVQLERSQQLSGPHAFGELVLQ
jgi:hypothetical protein